MNKQWNEQGECEEKDILKLINTKKDYPFFLAFHTDGFVSGRNNETEIQTIQPERLLELRVFGEKGELLVQRNMIGARQKFQYRTANEEALNKGGNQDYLVSYQTLDIDQKKTKVINEGMRSLMTTGGGRYSLPINETEYSIKIITYVDYDEDGMAFIYDHRLAGFVKVEEDENV